MRFAWGKSIVKFAAVKLAACTPKAVCATPQACRTCGCPGRLSRRPLIFGARLSVLQGALIVVACGSNQSAWSELMPPGGVCDSIVSHKETNRT
jgi:hypothetical protein